MTEQRALFYENAIWLLTQIDAECEAGEAQVGRIAAAAEAAAFIVSELRRTEIEKPRRKPSWERALDRNHLALVRES